MNYQSLRHTRPFSFLVKSTGPILPSFICFYCILSVFPCSTEYYLEMCWHQYGPFLWHLREGKWLLLVSSNHPWLVIREELVCFYIPSTFNTHRTFVYFLLTCNSVRLIKVLIGDTNKLFYIYTCTFLDIDHISDLSCDLLLICYF